MPFPMKIQPIDFYTSEEATTVVKPVMAKSRLKRLFERQFSGVLKSSVVPEKTVFEESPIVKDGSNGCAEFEPSSVCLANMVQSFIEETDEKRSSTVRCSRNRCNCFHGNGSESSDDELENFGGYADSSYCSSSGETCEILKAMVPCPSVTERNLLADTASIVEMNKICKREDGFCMKMVTDGLLALGYDASICKSRWEKSPRFPAGEYEYIDVIIQGERVIIDIDLRSEFEIARSTKTYKAILQIVPYIFVGKCDRLEGIIAIVSEAARQSLKKKGMHVPPWRKTEYFKAKWLSNYTRIRASSSHGTIAEVEKPEPHCKNTVAVVNRESVGETEKNRGSCGDDGKGKVVMEWKPPEVKPKSSRDGCKVLTGLAAVIEDKSRFNLSLSREKLRYK